MELLSLKFSILTSSYEVPADPRPFFSPCSGGQAFAFKELAGFFWQGVRYEDPGKGAVQSNPDNLWFGEYQYCAFSP
jgi:hypothetical protein